MLLVILLVLRFSWLDSEQLASHLQKHQKNHQAATINTALTVPMTLGRPVLELLIVQGMNQNSLHYQVLALRVPRSQGIPALELLIIQGQDQNSLQYQVLALRVPKSQGIPALDLLIVQGLNQNSLQYRALTVFVPII